MTSIPSTIPLFPLPDVVLFPHMPLPLHVFEPRYRKMTADVMASHQIIGMTLLKPGWDKDYYGRPPVYAVGCAGVVEECRPLEDGRFNIRLKGVSRFRIRSEQGGEPYRLAAVERLTDEIGDAAALESGRERVLAAIGRAADGPGLRHADAPRTSKHGRPIRVRPSGRLEKPKRQRRTQPWKRSTAAARSPTRSA